MFKWITRRIEQKTNANTLAILSEFFVRRTSSGQVVNAETALGVTTVLRCATLLGNGCQQIPFGLYLSEDDGKTRTKVAPAEHPVARVLRRPNRWQTPGAFRRTMTMHAALSDFGLAIKTIGARGQLLELLPCNPAWVSWKQNDDWSVTYRVSWPQGGFDDFAEDEVFVLRGPSWDAVKGLGALKYAREAIGLRMAVDESQGQVFKNGVRTAGALVSKDAIPEKEQRDRIKSEWQDAFGGSENHGKTPLLEGGLEFKPMGMDNVDADTMALRSQQVEEICRAFGVFPQMVGHMGESSPTFASAEQFFVQHVVHTLMPWHVEWEEAAASQLLTEGEQDAGYYFKHTVQALLRGTAADRAGFFEKMVRMSAMNPNEVRALEELDADPSLTRFQIPANTTVLLPDGTPAPMAIKPTEQIPPPAAA